MRNPFGRSTWFTSLFPGTVTAVPSAFLGVTVAPEFVAISPTLFVGAIGYNALKDSPVTAQVWNTVSGKNYRTNKANAQAAIESKKQEEKSLKEAQVGALEDDDLRMIANHLSLVQPVMKDPSEVARARRYELMMSASSALRVLSGFDQPLKVYGVDGSVGKPGTSTPTYGRNNCACMQCRLYKRQEILGEAYIVLNDNGSSIGPCEAKAKKVSKKDRERAIVDEMSKEYDRIVALSAQRASVIDVDY